MLHPLFNAKFIILSAIFLVLFITNAFILREGLFGAVLLIFLAGLTAPTLGQVVAPEEGRLTQTSFGLFVLLSFGAIIGSLFYYLASFTVPVAITITLLVPPIVWLVKNRTGRFVARAPIKHDPIIEQGKKSWISQTMMAAALVSMTAVVILIIKAATEEAINSPWAVVSPLIFLLFGITSLLLTLLITQARQRVLVLPLVSIVLFIFLAVVLFVFPLGYGFDSFIHQATEKHIAEFGTITPKPFYYIGQYSIVLFLHFAFSVPIEWADKLLVPILAVGFLPIVWLTAAAHLLKEKQTAFRSLIILFLLPLSSFIVTTPQSLGNLWFLLLLLFAVPRLCDYPPLKITKEKTTGGSRLWPLVIGAIAALLIHPIAGLPALLFCALLAANPDEPKQKNPTLSRIFSWIIILFGGFAVPIIFVINNLQSGRGWGFNLSNLTPVALIHNLHLDLFFENRYSPIFDFIYLFGWNQIILLILAAVVGMIWSRRTILKTIRVYLAMAAILFVNWLVIKSAVDFSFLIDYERDNYTERLIPLITFCLIPFLIIFTGRLFTILQKKPLILKTSAIILFTALTVSAFYLNYPRADAYETSHNFNVSRADLAAVAEIERNTDGFEYIVLANQSTSAAAVRQFGFVKYYDRQFFYPIPTSGTLYQLFLKMNENPSKTTALTAMDLFGIDRVYYLVSDYWWQAERLRETAKTNADEWWSVEDGDILIFEYKR